MTELPLHRPVLLLSWSDVASLMRPSDYLDAVEAAFRAGREGRAVSPPPMHLAGQGGAFHAKGASYENYVALKLNGNFPGNPERCGLPTIQGAILLCDTRDGSLLAIIDSVEVTRHRTPAASALAARFLARKDSSVLGICGCGDQALAHVEALAEVLALRRCFAFDLVEAKALDFAREVTAMFGIDCDVAGSAHDAAIAGDVVVTCTTAKMPILEVADVKPGTFIAAVGCDSPDKSEIAPELMAASTIVVDVLDQCVAMGDLRHAVAAGMMTADKVHADLGDLVTGAVQGRWSAEEIIIFDSTGTALQDTASAALIYERAAAAGIGATFAIRGG